MPNQIQNWDMVYAMTFNALNAKLEKDFEATKAMKNELKKLVVGLEWTGSDTKTIIASMMQKVFLDVINKLIDNKEQKVNTLSLTLSSVDIKGFKEAVGTVYKEYILKSKNKNLNKYKSNVYLKGESDTEADYLVEVVKAQVQNAIIAAKLNPSSIQNADSLKPFMEAMVTSMYPQSSCNTLFAAAGNDEIVCTLDKAWSFITGGDSDRVRIEIPFSYTTNLTKTKDTTENKTKVIIELNLKWVQQARVKDMLIETVKDGELQYNKYIKLIEFEFKSDDYSKPDETTLRNLFLGIINNLTNTPTLPSSTSQSFLGYLYNMLLDSLNVFQELATQDKFTWMSPTTTAYTTSDFYDIVGKEDSIFGILCMTDGRSNKEKPVIDINIIPNGADTAIIITPELLMQHILKPKIQTLFKDPTTTATAKDASFDEITPTAFENKAALTFLSEITNRSVNNNKIQPSIPENTFLSALEDNSLVLNFREMTYNWDENENFKIALQHKMKGRFSTKDKEGNWIDMKEDSSTVTPNVTPIIRISPLLQVFIDFASTFVFSGFDNWFIEKKFKKWFIENATKSVSSIYHNHVTNDMEALQNLLAQQNEKENKEFMADLIKYQSNIKSKTLDADSYKFKVSEVLKDYLFIQLTNPNTTPPTTHYLSFKIIPTKSKFDNGGMQFINFNHEGTQRTNVRPKKTIEIKEVGTLSQNVSWMKENNEKLVAFIRNKLEQQVRSMNALKSKPAQPSNTGNNAIQMAEDNLPFLNVALGTTTCETEAFIKQLHEYMKDTAIILNNAILETKTTRVVVTDACVENKVVYLILQVDSVFVFLKTNSEKNEYGGLEFINYNAEQQPLRDWLKMQVLRILDEKKTTIKKELEMLIPQTEKLVERQIKLEERQTKGEPKEKIEIEAEKSAIEAEKTAIEAEKTQIDAEKSAIRVKEADVKSIEETIKKYNTNALTSLQDAKNWIKLLNSLNQLAQPSETMAPLIDLWMETNKTQLQEIRYALTLKIYNNKVFEEFSNQLNPRSTMKLKVGGLALATEKAYSRQSKTEIFIFLTGVNCQYSYLGIELTPIQVKLYGVNNIADSNGWTNQEITRSEFEYLYPDSVRQIVNELKRIAFAKNVNVENRELWTDLIKDTVVGAGPLALSKLSEWMPPTDPTNDINNQGKIKDLEGVVNKALREITWPGSNLTDLKLEDMDLNGNFRLAFTVPVPVPVPVPVTP